MYNIQQTSMESYWSLGDKIGKRQQLVLDALKKLGTANNRQLKDFLGLEINTITPRVNELRKKHLVEESHKAEDPITGKLTIFWRCK